MLRVRWAIRRLKSRRHTGPPVGVKYGVNRHDRSQTETPLVQVFHSRFAMVDGPSAFAELGGWITASS